VKQFVDVDEDEVTPVEAKQSKPKSDDPDELYSLEAMSVKVSDTPHASAGNVITLPNRISVGKPSKQAYFRCHPDFFVTTRLINHEASRAFYYPLGDVVLGGLCEFVKIVDLYGIITRGGEFRFGL